MPWAPQLVTMRDELGRVPDRFEVLLAVAGRGHERDGGASGSGCGSGFPDQACREQPFTLLGSPCRNSSTMSPEDRAEYQAFQRYAKILTRVEQVPQIQQAMKWAPGRACSSPRWIS